jgi:hypothetical protein
MQIKKIREFDYPRGRAQGYYASRIIGIISAKSLKPVNFYFTPLSAIKADISPQLGRKSGTPWQSQGELLD